ncbi:hypothetical protein LIER_02454 [Lithospermum erythrorhizon]|uniref:Uncharacterized protein n=1 Tax=Lithospermum erythrorhizon TaxID=34254 RepID=A0AAV3NPY2_LITER
MQQTADHEWLLEHEPQGDNAEEEAQESDEEDIVAAIIKRRKATSKLKLNENRTRVGNKRVPKNVVVSTMNVALNSKEEQAKWRFVANRRVTAKKMFYEVTNKNANIICILEGADFMPTVEAIGPYYPQLVRDFVCNMAEDIDNPASPNFQKLTFRNFTFDFSPSLVNAFYERENGGQIGYNLQLLEIVKVLTEDVEGPSPGFITISPKLIQETHVANIPLVTVDTSGASGSGTDKTIKILRDELRHLDGVIQSSLARKYVLEARLRSLSGEDDAQDEAIVGDGGAETPLTS